MSLKYPENKSRGYWFVNFIVLFTENKNSTINFETVNLDSPLIFNFLNSINFEPDFKLRKVSRPSKWFSAVQENPKFRAIVNAFKIDE